MKKRVFLIVLDSFGIGELPDAGDFGDKGTNTLGSISRSSYFCADNMIKLGLSSIDGVNCLPSCTSPIGAYARMAELSRGKDTTVGHWEIAGLISEKPLPTYPNGFPSELLDEFSRQTGRGVLCNKPYSGTDVIRDFGQRHIETGDLIVYTSADSVFQIAAHEDIVPVEQLYEYCRIARRLLCGEHGVGRVIARPFIGEYPNFTRSAKRHDFSLEPTGKTLLDLLSESGKDVISVGKIYDIFAGRSVSESNYTHSNTEGMQKTLEIADRDFDGLCFVNLVDFDMMYGHRNDIDGYARATAEFNAWLPKFMSKMKHDDMLIITADHGCDPGYIQSTDHSREYTPCLIYGDGIKPENLGTRSTFADIAATVAHELSVEYGLAGESML